jgi:alkanesulfonate monooxygenase SsuD/methylene tetrahydromethanopterin reductase-like flavin-dependent oxidoreductase (luciferase family)
VGATPEEAAERRGRLREACEREGRDPDTLRFSVMHPFVVGSEEADLRRRADELAALGQPGAGEGLSGTPDRLVERLGEYAEAGVERVMLQHLLHRDTEALELLAAEVVPALA